MKPLKMPCIIYAGLKSLIKKIDGCVNYPEKSSKEKICEHISCRYSISTIWTFDNIKQKHTLYCDKDLTKSISLRECSK